MKTWDESMFAVNTYEMLKNGNYFSLYYNGLPDLYNTKPPLTNWLQLLCVKILGYNELAIRIPSALATFLVIIFSFKFVAKYFDYVWAWVVALILVSSAGVVGFHTSRTGESDAILSLFLLLCNLTFIRYILEERKRDIFLVFIFMTLAFATKLYAAFLFLPAFLFVLIYYKKFKSFVFSLPFLIGTIVFLVTSLSLIILRDMESPGYLKIIWTNDAGRLFIISKEFEKSVYFYIENFYDKRYSLFFIAFVIGSIFLFTKKLAEQKQRILFMSFVLVGFYLLIISVSRTKLYWYDLPLYPFIALISAYTIVEVINIVLKQKDEQKPFVKYLLVGLIFFYPYYFRFSKSQGNKIDDGEIVEEANERYLHQAIGNGTNVDGLKVLYQSFNGPLLFYKYKLIEAGQEIELHTDTDDFEVGDKVLVCKDKHREALREKFEIIKTDGYQTADVYLLKEN
jgi:4-amino-4-deoxy-L-arabinose transferase-like glycosyltransferase